MNALRALTQAILGFRPSGALGASKQHSCFFVCLRSFGAYQKRGFGMLAKAAHPWAEEGL